MKKLLKFKWIFFLGFCNYLGMQKKNKNLEIQKKNLKINHQGQEINKITNEKIELQKQIEQFKLTNNNLHNENAEMKNYINKQKEEMEKMKEQLFAQNKEMNELKLLQQYYCGIIKEKEQIIQENQEKIKLKQSILEKNIQEEVKKYLPRDNNDNIDQNNEIMINSILENHSALEEKVAMLQERNNELEKEKNELQKENNLSNTLKKIIHKLLIERKNLQLEIVKQDKQIHNLMNEI